MLHRIAALLRFGTNPKGAQGRLAVSWAGEAVGKPQNFAFSRQKVLGFQGSNFSKEPFSTASLGRCDQAPELRR
jgi:hypothetical protein